MTDGGATPRPAAGTGRFRVRHVAEVDSTNRVLLEEAAAGAPEGEVLVADHQTAGRGRRGRSWSAPPGSSLLVSVLLRPRLPLDRAHLVTMALGVAAAEACEEVAGVAPLLKWPNDLVVPAPRADRKLAGVLAESVVAGGRLSALVVGMGMNVNWASPLPADLAASATALSREAGAPVDRGALLATLLARFERWYAGLGDGRAGAAAVRTAWVSRSATLDRVVRVDLGGEVVEGVATTVTDEGHLVVEAHGPTGVERRVLAAGDVVHLRPAPR